MRLVGIIPAAGYATRLQPLHCSKEVFPIGGQPVMNYLLDRMRAGAGGDGDSRSHQACQEGRGGDCPAPRCDCDRRRAAHLVRLDRLGAPRARTHHIVMLGFPHTVWEPLDGFRPLVDAVRSAKCEAALGLFPAADPNTCDVVITDSDDRVVDIEVKSPNPSSNVIWGCLVARAGLLRGLARTTEVGDHIRRFIGERSILGLGVSDTFVDIGKSRQTLRGELAGDGS